MHAPEPAAAQAALGRLLGRGGTGEQSGSKPGEAALRKSAALHGREDAMLLLMRWLHAAVVACQTSSVKKSTADRLRCIPSEKKDFEDSDPLLV